jgi:recombinational DNA repair protein (RecF pathway)
MSVYYGTEAYLVASRDWGEADRLLTFFSRDLGRVDAIAKSVRLAKSKLRGHLNLFSRIRIMVTPGSSQDAGQEYWRLLDAEQTTAPAISHATLPYVSEITRFLSGITARGQHANELWNICDSLDRIAVPHDVCRAKIEILRSLGMLPDARELQLFFSPRAVAFIKNEGDASFFSDIFEVDAFDAGIRQILAANHMI